MKFILQLEVEAPENTNKNFPKAAHAIQWLHDQLQSAIIHKFRLQSLHIKNSHTLADPIDENFIIKLDMDVEKLKEVIETVKEKQ